MKKGISLLCLALALSSCGPLNFGPQDEEIPFDEPTSEETTDDEEHGDHVDPIVPEVIKVNAFTLKDNSLSLGLSSTYRLKYTVLPENASNKKIKWTSLNTRICSVDSTGLVTTIREGETTIKAETTDGSNFVRECQITVQKISVSDITVNKTSITFYEGESASFSCTVLPSDANNKTLNVISLDEDIARVSEQNATTFKVDAIKKGETQIQISSVDNPSVVKLVSVKVNDVKLESIALNSNYIYLNEESTFQLSVRYTPSNASNKKVTFVSDNPQIAEVSESGLVTAKSTGTTNITVTSNDGNFTQKCSVSVEEKGKLIKSSLLYKQKDVFNNYASNVDCAPSIGEVNILVIPVWFSDSLSFIASQKKEVVRKDIEKSFIGTKEQTGWRSVKGYYDELSKGKLSMNPIVSEWYECGMKSSDFYSEDSGLDKTSSLVNSATVWYKNKNKLDSLKDFDSDRNGFIDGVVLIYACPDYNAWEKYSTGYTNLWAYTYWLSDNRASVAQPTANAFMWASYDFMYGSNIAESRTAKSTCAGGDTSNCTLDAHTYIHEMGHVLGLNDYYDYSNTYTASAGFSMQDFNIGSHDPYSCMKWGWAEPYVATGDTTITIGDFQSTRDVFMVTNNFSGSPFDEYFLIELYTPTGLNEFDSTNVYGGEESGRPLGVNKPGIRLWHVDGRLAYAKRTGLDYSFSADKVTTNPYIEDAEVCELMANSFNTPERETLSILSDYSELFLVRNDKDVDYRPLDDDWMFNDKCMFYQGDTFNINTYAKQFKNSKKGVEEALLNNGEEFRFNIKIETLNESSATIKISTY